jgi:4-carboxymuconolactone decarboxylase
MKAMDDIADVAPADALERGRAILAEIAPDGGHALIASLDAAAPDFARHVVGFAFGEICARPGLDLATRELLTVAALTALGTAVPQLRFHIRAAERSGCSRAAIVEAIVQMAVYAGFPAALNGLAAAHEVFAEATPPPTTDRSAPA